MVPVIWLLIGLAAGVGAAAVGLPAWRQVRARETRDLNVDRYRAWRGQSRPVTPRPREGLTLDERRRLVAAGVLAAVAILGILAFFLTS